MSSNGATFSNLPPFPNDVPTAPLLTISLAKLLQHDSEEEEQRLWDACRQLGFFYLDLRPQGATNGTAEVDPGTALQHLADELFEVEEQVFGLPLAEKQSYDFAAEGSYYGYKGYGKGVIDAKGNLDRNEFYNTSKDDVLGLSDPLPGPKNLAVGHENRQTLKSFITQSHEVVMLILDTLSLKLGLEPECLANLHRIHRPSGDQVRFVKAPPQAMNDEAVALGAHTDFGSVTVLFNRLGGLQVRLPPDVEPIQEQAMNGNAEEYKRFTETSDNGEQWAYVRPLPNHCIINLGDALVQFSAGILRSNTHRVVPPPGAQRNETRYSLVYFSRPEDEVLLKPLAEESEMIAREAALRSDLVNDQPVNAKDWVLRRALGRRGAKGLRFEDSGGTEDARAIKV